MGGRADLWRLRARASRCGWWWRRPIPRSCRPSRPGISRPTCLALARKEPSSRSSRPADLAEVVRLYGLRNWVEQSYKQVKVELGWADFQVRSDLAIRTALGARLSAPSRSAGQTGSGRQEAGESGGSSRAKWSQAQPAPARLRAAPKSETAELETESPTPPAEEEAWRWGKNEGRAREDGRRSHAEPARPGRWRYGGFAVG